MFLSVKTVSKDELVACLPYLYCHLEDRNADVRKNAQEATLGVMIHVGYEGMLKATSSLKVIFVDKCSPLCFSIRAKCAKSISCFRIFFLSLVLAMLL